MPRMTVLNAAERQIYENAADPRRPVLQRLRAFDVPAGLLGLGPLVLAFGQPVPGFELSCLLDPGADR